MDAIYMYILYLVLKLNTILIDKVEITRYTKITQDCNYFVNCMYIVYNIFVTISTHLINETTRDFSLSGSIRLHINCVIVLSLYRDIF